jgi:hypothetical protein
MQQDCASEAKVEWGNGEDMSLRMGKASDLRNALYAKLKEKLANFKLIDPATQEELKIFDSSTGDMDKIKLYLKGSWFFESCRRDETGTPKVPISDTS